MGLVRGLPSLPVSRSELRPGNGRVRNQRRFCNIVGGVVSPLLANLFMHYAFDLWMRRTFPDIRFERYADDVIIHAKSRVQAEHVLEAVRRRLKECRLELHPEK